MRKLVEEGPSSVPPLTERQKELLADFKEKTLATKDERKRDSYRRARARILGTFEEQA
jgi:hypothetical protein